MSEKLCALRKIGGGMSWSSETLLWSNPSPSASFTGTTVTPSSSLANFKGIKIVWKAYTNTSATQSISISMDNFKMFTNGNVMPLYISGGSGTSRGCRSIAYGSDTSIVISGGLPINGTGSYHPAAIPLEIYGLK